MNAIEGDGIFLTLRFRVTGQAGQKTPLTLEKAQAFQPGGLDMITEVQSGEIGVTAAIPWLWIALAAAGVVLLLLLLVLLFRRRRPRQPAPQPAAAAQAAAAPEAAAPLPKVAPLPRFAPKGQPIQHRCTKCGGMLELPAEMLGRKFECSACGCVQVAGQ